MPGLSESFVLVYEFDFISLQDVLSAMENNLLTSQGVVVELDGAFALVDVQRQTGCGGCQSQAGCGTATLSKLFSPNRSAPVRVLNTLDAQVGDRVVVSLDESQVVRQAFMAYGLPLIGLFLVAIVLKFMAQTLFSMTALQLDLVAILGGAAGLVLGWGLTRKLYQPSLPVLTEKL
ncbi:SoxR reducing system RseC family protein [Thiomicrorhabdus chilensis]|uniref:SoxR reducing system RseC family protein n=1 Tax=Thiomicrorhabdus chilensis TaxID=63656 RepID=UPI0003FFB629|nr:SoxR reducing system RseC family protein [Thiomicrorhabdus chilensis]